MLMLCVFYCVPLARFLYFASSGILFVLALFALKRGIYTHRPRLRLAAFCMMFLSVFKALMVDARLEKQDLLCHVVTLPYLSCTPQGFMTADFLGILLFISANVALLQAYRVHMPEKNITLVPPDKVHLRFWANIGLWGVVAMLCWLAAPWVGFLTVGSVPRIFTVVPWGDFALVNLALLLIGFWKAENCSWTYEVKHKDKLGHLTDTWTAKDTLYLNVFLYLIALALSYVSQDILAVGPK